MVKITLNEWKIHTKMEIYNDVLTSLTHALYNKCKITPPLEVISIAKKITNYR